MWSSSSEAQECLVKLWSSLQRAEGDPHGFKQISRLHGECVLGFCSFPALAPNIVAHKFLVMNSSESAHLVPHVPSPPSPVGICSPASVSWVTFYPCPSKLCRLTALSCQRAGSRSVSRCTNGLLEFVHFSLAWTSHLLFPQRGHAVKTHCVHKQRCALVAQITGLNVYLNDRYLTSLASVSHGGEPVLVS